MNVLKGLESSPMLAYYMMMTRSAPLNTLGLSLWRMERYDIISCATFWVLKNNLCDINVCCPDCGVSGQWPAGVQKLHLLASAARLHKGHQHPPAFSPHQHPVRTLDLQGPERSHRHTQGEAQTSQINTKMELCWETLVPQLVQPNLQLWTNCTVLRPRLTLTCSTLHIHPYQGLMPDLYSRWIC